MHLQRLHPSFCNDRTEQVAQKLLGKLIVRSIGSKQLVGKIVETECYTFGDPASHCYQNKTVRNRALFGPVGHAYIYKIYGIHYGFNVVAYDKQEDQAGGVLIRAVEPILGIEHMQSTRAVTGYALTNGPGKLTQAFGINTAWYSHNLITGDTLFLAETEVSQAYVIRATTRIGITKGRAYKGRFFIQGNPWVTPHRLNV